MSNENGGNFHQQLEHAGFSFKPSFYLMGLSQFGTGDLTLKSIQSQLSEAAVALNKSIKESKDEPTDYDFGITSVERIDSDVYEIRLRWEAPVRYWNPKKLSPESVSSLKVGFVLLHMKARKALVACHTLTERSHITQIVSEALKVGFTPLTLTKRLLDQIGTFDTVKRAAYTFAERRADRARNISFADDLLGSIPEVRAHEDNLNAERKLSFYRIPLTGMGERGVGATSESAKLWIPSDTPVVTVREFGIALLERVTGTLRRMKKEGDFEGILRVVLSDANPNLAAISPVSLRRDIQELASTLIRMLETKEPERAFRPLPTFITSGVPDYFEHPRLALFDEESASTEYWRFSDGSELLKFREESGRWAAVSYPSSVVINLAELVHPVLGTTVSITDPLAAVQIYPTKKLHDLLLEIVKSVANDLPELSGVVALPFSFGSGLLKLDLKRAKNAKEGALVGRSIPVAELKQLSRVVNRNLSPQKREANLVVLDKLGEKCRNMTDHNCSACLDDRQFLCLRSLLARFMREHLLLPHKNIELCDLQGRFDHDEMGKMQLFVFAKLSKGEKGLTLRNNNGSVLLAQIVAHLEKPTFTTIGVLSSSPINEDLRERLTFLGGLVNKSVIFFDGPILAKMLSEFEEVSKVEGLDPNSVYKTSKVIKGVLPDGKKAPGSLAAPL